MSFTQPATPDNPRAPLAGTLAELTQRVAGPKRGVLSTEAEAIAERLKTQEQVILEHHDPPSWAIDERDDR